MRGRGFTLLEVVVALAILGLALMAIFDLNAGAVAMHAYAKRATVATFLARSKMVDLEQDLYDEGMPADDDEDSGDFSNEGWPSYKWRARILAPRTTGVSTDQLLATLFNLPVGEEGGDMSELIGAMFGGGAGDDGAAGAGAGGLMAGAMGGVAQQQVTQFLDEIAKSVREVHLTVTWKNGNEVETLDLVTHVISMGPGSDRNGGAAAAGGMAAAGANNPADPWVNGRTGAPIQGEPLMRNNVPWDPNSPTDMAVHRSQFLMMQSRSPFGQNPAFNPVGQKRPGL